MSPRGRRVDTLGNSEIATRTVSKRRSRQRETSLCPSCFKSLLSDYHALLASYGRVRNRATAVIFLSENFSCFLKNGALEFDEIKLDVHHSTVYCRVCVVSIHTPPTSTKPPCFLGFSVLNPPSSVAVAQGCMPSFSIMHKTPWKLIESNHIKSIELRRRRPVLTPPFNPPL